MLKKLFIFVCLCVIGGTVAVAQNIQLHYDLGSHLYDKDLANRPNWTTTVEMFKPDPWGSTYLFVDADYTDDGIASAYWEIARELKFWKNPFSVHLEYNGGTSNQFSYLNSYLLGGAYTYNSEDFSKGFAIIAAYKFIQKHKCPHNYQLTGTWHVHFAKRGLCTFIGFFDLWKEKTYYEDGSHKNFIFLTEPQFWVNLNKIKGVNEKFKLSVGSELELSQNFGARKGFYAVPTLALKWSFD